MADSQRMALNEERTYLLKEQRNLQKKICDFTDRTPYDNPYLRNNCASNARKVGDPINKINVGDILNKLL